MRCLDDPATIGQTYECAGPRVYTLGELVRAGRPLVGPRAGRCSPLPAALGRLQALVMELLPGEPLMSRDNLDSMRVAQRRQRQAAGLERAGHRARGAGRRSRRGTSAMSPARRALDAWRARARRG